MKIISPKFGGDRQLRQCTVALTAGVQSAGDILRQKRRGGGQREDRALMNNSPLCALLLLLIFAYAQGNDSAVQLRAPPSADLYSIRLNQASIL